MLKSIISFVLVILCSKFLLAYEPSGCNPRVFCNSILKDGLKTGTEVCTDDKGVIVKEANWKNNKLEGKFKCLKEDGESSVEAFYKNDELDGEYKEYLKNEKRWEIQNYKKGEREGIRIQPSSNGHSLISNYKSDAKYGFTYIINSNGEVVEAKDCEEDHEGLPADKCLKMNIPALLDYLIAYKKVLAEKESEKLKKYGNREEKYPNGKLMTKYFLDKNGWRDGESINYYENGNIQSRSQYRQNKKVGKEILYFENGDKEEEITYNDKSVVIERTSYFMNKKVNERYKLIKYLPPDGMRSLVEVEEHHSNGALYYKGKQIQNRVGWGFVYDGVQEYFGYEGELEMRFQYDMGTPIGKWYYKGDDTYTEATYSKGKLEKETIFDEETKAIKSEIEYHPDRSVKKEKKF